METTHSNLKSLVRQFWIVGGLSPVRYSQMMRLARKVGNRTGRTAVQVVDNYIATYKGEWA